MILRVDVDISSFDSSLNEFRIINFEDYSSFSSKSTSIFLDELGDVNGVVGVTGKLKGDGAVSGFCSYRRGGVDLLLCSYFCRPGITESFGMMMENERWLRISISNRKAVTCT